jgi:hypothetical protein
VLLRYPDLLRDLISVYDGKSATAYDFHADPGGVFSWDDVGRQFARDQAVDLRPYRPVTGSNLYSLVLAICRRFCGLIENNGLDAHLYKEDGHTRHERYAQLLFFAVADVYCEANDLDVSREPNAGRGQVDFKISRGYFAKVTVEVKYTSNAKLRDGYEKQLPEYSKAEHTDQSILLVIQTTSTSKQLDEIRRLHDDRASLGERPPEIVVADGRLKPSASKV